MLGSMSDADDALQEAWLRIRDRDAGSVENMRAWLTTIVGRVCLNMLRSRRSRREDAHVPDPVVRLEGGVDPEQETLLAESVGLALLVVLDTLTPAERLAFVLHDVFGVPFADIAAALDRSEAAAQQLASRARRRVRGAPEPDGDLTRQRRVVDAFFTASRDGDFDALLAVLDPDVVLRADMGPLGGSHEVRGAVAVARRASFYAQVGLVVRPALVNGAVGAVTMRDGEPFSVGSVIVRGGRIVELDILADPERLRRLDLTVLDG
jgi:RNA polymerase sigma-70 factor (ECF subfamily)